MQTHCPPHVQVNELNQRLRHKHITLTLTDAALDYAVQQSFDHMCAARDSVMMCSYALCPALHPASCWTARLRLSDLLASVKDSAGDHIACPHACASVTKRRDWRTGRRYGARPLRRWMEKTILTDLSRMLVSGELSEFAAVKCDVAPDGSGLSYKVEKTEPAPGVPEQQDSKRARWAGASKPDEDDEEMEE